MRSAYRTEMLDRAAVADTARAIVRPVPDLIGQMATAAR